MSFVDEREQGLILGLLLGRLAESEFYRLFPMAPGQGSDAGLAMLSRALRERDPTGVEFGLYLGNHFGISDKYLDVLLLLATESWHELHESVVDALAKLKSPRSVDVLFRIALTTFPYRDYDEANSLGTKCVWALRAIESREAVGRLEEILLRGDTILQREAEARLQDIAVEGGSEEVRLAAREALAAAHRGT